MRIETIINGLHHTDALGCIQGNLLPQSLRKVPPLEYPSHSSRAKILKEDTGVDPGWVDIIPLKRVMLHVLT